MLFRSWIEESGIPINIIRSNQDTRPSDNTKLSAVDIANLVKALDMQETHLGNYGEWDKVDGDDNIGHMQNHIWEVHDDGTFDWYMLSGGATYANPYVSGFVKLVGNNNEELNKPFVGFGVGIGNLFSILTARSSYPYNGISEANLTTPTYSHWKESLRAWNPGKPNYLSQILSIYENGKYHDESNNTYRYLFTP